MAHQVVMGADQLVTAEAADLDERRVGVGDTALKVGTGDQEVLVVEDELSLCRGLIVAHHAPCVAVFLCVSFWAPRWVFRGTPARFWSGRQNDSHSSSLALPSARLVVLLACSLRCCA